MEEDAHIGNMLRGKSGEIWPALIPVLCHRCSRIILSPADPQARQSPNTPGIHMPDGYAPGIQASELTDNLDQC
jgi:hypothetical protein